MKKLILLLSLISLGLVGCSSNDRSRMEYIEQKFKTREIHPIDGKWVYVIRLADGSVLVVSRYSDETPEKQTYHQIFGPTR